MDPRNLASLGPRMTDVIVITYQHFASFLCLSQESIPLNYPHETWVWYILASRKGGTLYTGVTTDLPRRIEEHRLSVGSKFTSKYKVKRLVLV